MSNHDFISFSISSDVVQIRSYFTVLVRVLGGKHGCNYIRTRTLYQILHMSFSRNFCIEFSSFNCTSRDFPHHCETAVFMFDVLYVVLSFFSLFWSFKHYTQMKITYLYDIINAMYPFTFPIVSHLLHFLLNSKKSLRNEMKNGHGYRIHSFESCSSRFDFSFGIQTKKSTRYPKHNHTHHQQNQQQACVRKKSVIKERCTHLTRSMVNLTTLNQQSPPYRPCATNHGRGHALYNATVNSPNFGSGEVDEARRGVRISQEHTQCSLLHSRRDSTIAYTRVPVRSSTNRYEESQNL